MYVCNMHGEPLRYDAPRNTWKCPEFTICGTYVTDEFVHLRAKRVVGVATEHSIEDPFTGEITVSVLLGNSLDEQVKAFLDDYLWNGRRHEAIPEDYVDNNPKWRQEYEGNWTEE